MRDLHELDRPLASSWQLYDDGQEHGPALVAEQIQGGPIVIIDQVAWSADEFVTPPLAWAKGQA